MGDLARFIEGGLPEKFREVPVPLSPVPASQAAAKSKVVVKTHKTSGPSDAGSEQLAAPRHPSWTITGESQASATLEILIALPGMLEPPRIQVDLAKQALRLKDQEGDYRLEFELPCAVDPERSVTRFSRKHQHLKL